MANKKTKRPKFYGFKPTNQDDVLLAKLEEKLGINNFADLVRVALRRLADAEGLRAA